MIVLSKNISFSGIGVTLIYYFLILFISYTLMNKLMAIDSFQVNLLKTGLYSNTAVKYLSYTVLTGESAVLLLLLFNKKIGSVLLLLMFIVFTLYICYLRFFGRYEVCGCGGVLNGLEFRYHFMINSFLIILSTILFRDNFKKSNNEN